MLGKNRLAGFSFKLALFLCRMKNNKRTEKPARGFFPQHFSREGAILRRRSAGAEHPNARKMRFAVIRGGVQGKALRAASNGQSPFGLIHGSIISCIYSNTAHEIEVHPISELTI